MSLEEPDAESAATELLDIARRIDHVRKRAPSGVDAKLADYQHDLAALAEALENDDEDATDLARSTRALEEFRAVQEGYNL